MSFESLARKGGECARHDEAFSVLFMDLNGFKQVNDNYGHGVGDELIRQAGPLASGVARPTSSPGSAATSSWCWPAGTTASDGLAERIAEVEPAVRAVGGRAERLGQRRHRELSRATVRPQRRLTKNADIAMYRAKRVTLARRGISLAARGNAHLISGCAGPPAPLARHRAARQR